MKRIQLLSAAALLLAVLASPLTPTPTAQAAQAAVPSSMGLFIHVDEQGWAAGCQSYKTTLPFTLRTRYWDITGWVNNDYTLGLDCYGNVSGTIDAGDAGTALQMWLKGPRWTADYWSGTTTYELSWTSTPRACNTYECNKAGDVDNNNVVNLYDYNALRATFGKCQGTPGYDARADFDMNNCVATGDFVLLQNNYGSGGPPSW